MEAKNRLEKLLSMDRSLRRESLETKDVEPTGRSRAAPPASIDTSPITSPENMELTRRRLSKSLWKSKPEDRTAPETNVQAKLFAATKPSKEAAQHREPRRGRKEDYDENFEAKSTPLRVRKRVSIQEIAVTPGDEPPRNPNRIQKRALTRARSLSPLPTRSLQPLSHYPQREMHDMKTDEDDSVFEMDFHKFQDVDCKVAARIHTLGASADMRGINNEISAAGDILHAVGMSKLQLWTMDFETNTLTGERPDGTTATLNAYQSQLLLDFSRDSMQSFSAANSDMLVNPSNVCTWLASHPAYSAVRNTVLHGQHEHHYDTAHERDGDASQPAWSAIHALRLICRSSDSIYFNKTIGVLVVTEMADPALPFSGFYGINDRSMRKLRRFMSLQLLQKLGLAVENRLSMFEALNDQQELVDYIEQTRGQVTTKQIELTQKDMVIEAKEAAIRDRDLKMQCNDALVTCAALLGESKLHHSAFIASAVAKSGCIGDKTTHNATNCWFIFKEIDVMSLTSSGGRYPTEHHTVCTISGHARDGYNPVALVSGQNKLISRLLHGDVSGQAVTRVTSSRKDLFDAGLVVSELMAFETEPPGHSSPQLTHPWTVLSVPMKVNLSDKLAFDCPGHCTVLASVVITVPEGGDLDLFSAHVLSLTHLARRAFESLHAQYAVTLQQSLLSISSALYDAVTILKTAPVSDSFSPLKRHRGGGQRNTAQPVTTAQPQYQRALNSLLNTVSSADIASKFGVRKSVMVISDVCASNLRLSDPPTESRKLNFLTSNGSSLQSLACPAVDLSVTSWLQDLYSGKIVYFDSSDNFSSNTALPEAFNVDHSLRGSVSKQSKLVSPPYWEAQQLLRALVQAVDPHSTFCALVPIRTSSGLSVLMLIDKLSGVGQVSPAASPASPAARSEVIPFSAEYIDAVLAAGVCKDLMNSLVIVQQQCSAYWTERDLTDEIATLEDHEDKLCSLVNSVRAKSDVATRFARWKYATKCQADRELLDKSYRLLTAIMHLITHRTRVDLPDCRKSFLAVLEAQLKALFPLDSVSIRDSSQHSVPTSTEEDANSRSHLKHDIVNRFDVASPAPTSAVIPGAPVGSSRHNSSRKVVASVVVSRPAQLNRSFSQGEMDDFNAFCSTACDIFSALSRGYTNDLADGDVRSLVFPLLAQLLPALLTTTDSGPSSGPSALPDVRHLLPLLVQWLKRACNADMVLLRLAAFAGSNAETLLSSEEIEDSQIDFLKSKLPSLSELVQMQTAASNYSTSGVEVNSQESSDHILLKFLDRGSDGAAHQLGEVKILSTNKRHFTAEQRTVVLLISYLLTHAIRASTRAAHIRVKDTQLRSELIQMHSAVTTSQQAIIAETHSSEAFKSRLANLLSAIMFTDKVAATSSLSELAALVGDGLPKLIGVSSAVLLIDATQAPGSAGVAPDSFRVILPRSSRPSDALDSSNHSALANSVMSLQQVRQIPLMFQNEESSQCRIDLLTPDNEANFGAILIFRNAIGASGGARSPGKDEDSVAYKLWEGLEDILRNALSSAIFQCTSRISHTEQIDSLTRSLSKSTAILREQEHLEPDIANLLSIKNDLEEQRNALLTDVTSLKATIEEILSEKEQKLRTLEDEIQAIRSASRTSSTQSTEQISALERSLSAEKASLAKLDGSKKQLLELVSSFSFDQRCEQESVLLWLRDVADSADSSLQVMSQSEGGVLRGGEGIRGIMAAVGEAVRTGLTVEFTSTLASSDGKSGAPSKFESAPAPAAVRYTRSDGRSADTQLLKFDSGSFTRSNRRTLEGGADGNEEPMHIAVLCVPNRCAPANSTAEHACFIFVKGVGDPEDKYSAEEKDLLNSAANLSSRTLVQTSSKIAERDLRLLEAELEESRTLETRLRQVLNLGEVLRQREYQSKAEVSSGVEMCVKTLLSRGPRDSCLIETVLWLPPWNTAVDTAIDNARTVRHSSSHINVDLEALNRVLSTGQRMRRRGVCWIPLFDHRNEVIAILRVERKFSETIEHNESPQTSIDSTDLPTVAHLVITDIEEEMLVTFAAFAVPLLERMDFIGEAYSEVRQAGQAILALQKVNEATEDKYAEEVSHRLELEESLKAGAEMLGMISSTRIATGQLLDATRKSILTFTSSLDCFIIMPTIPLSATAGPPGQQQSIEYCTFTADLPREVAVVFEPGDLEAAAMQSFRSIASAADNTGAASSAHTDISPTGVRAWQSWAVRRLHAQMTFGLDLDQRLSNEEQDMYALAVPFALRSGALAVVSVVRRNAPFSSTDRECITWVSKVLAYCLEIKGAEETLAETVVQVGALQEEITRLKEIDLHLTELESDNDTLERNLLSSNMGQALLRELSVNDFAQGLSDGDKAPESSCARMIAAAARLVFGTSSHIESWSAEVLSEKLGASVPFLRSAVPNGFGDILIQKLKTPGREVLTTEAGSVMFWVETEGASRDALEFFRMLLSSSPPANSSGKATAGESSTRMRRRAQSATSALNDESPEGSPVIYLVVQLPDLGATWLRVSADDKVQHNLKLSVAVLLQLLGSVQPWQSKTIATQRALQEAIRDQAEEQQNFAAELAKRSAELEEMKESFVTNLDGTKVKYKSIVTEKSGNYRKAEKLFTETLFLTQVLRAEMLIKQTRIETVVPTVLECLLRFSKTAQPLTGMQVSVAQCATSAVADSAAQVPEVPQLALGRTGSSAQTKAQRNSSRSTGAKPTGPSFVAETPSGLLWLTEQPALGGRRTLSAPLPQHAAIRVELYGGQAHTNPLQIALATGKVVIFLPVDTRGDAGGSAGESADVHFTLRESLVSICRKLGAQPVASGASKDNTCICLNPTEPFPLFSMIIPIVLPGMDSTVLVVVRPNDPSATEEVSKYILYSLLCGILSLKQASLDLVAKKFQDREVSGKCKKLALVGMKRALDASNLTRATQALVFEKMKSSRLSAQVVAVTTTISTVQPQLTTARAQVRQLEQVSADWTEMVKGINGASGGIISGITGLWAQACPTLMNMLAANITVRGCGLLVSSNGKGAAASDNLVEYTVRELNTPLARAHSASSMFSPATVGEIEDYAHGALECRPASELGSSVVDLAQDILTGRTGNQRIFKLLRTRNGGYAATSGSNSISRSAESETSLWLVPVRTARSVLGVLRVSVEIHPVGTPPAVGTQTPSRSRHFASEPTEALVPQVGSSAVSALVSKAERHAEMVREQTAMLEGAQSNMINFSEVLAPLFFAAQQLDKANQRNSRLDQASQQSSAQVKAMTQEVQAVTKKSALLAGVIKAVGSLCCAELNLPFTTPEECLRVFCNRIALLLSERLAGRVVISIHRNILSSSGEDAAAGEPTDNRPEADSITEPLLDHSGKAFGRISFIPTLPKETTAGKDVPVADVGPRNLYASLSKPSATTSVSFVLLPLAHILSGLLLRTAKEIAAKAQVTTSVQNIRALEEALLQEQEAVTTCQQRSVEQTASNDFYRGLADVINQCLVYCSLEQEERFKYPGNGETYSFALCTALQESLMSLAEKLPALAGQSCSFNFALLDSKSSVVGDDGETLAVGDRRSHNVTWVTAGGTDRTLFFDWRRMGQDARDIVTNLAHTCIAKKLKSACDIGINLNRDANISVLAVQKFTNVRVISYPLLDQSNSTVLGVVQCLLDPTNQRTEVENLCEDVANCVACMLSVEVQQQKLCGRTQAQKVALLTNEVKNSENAQLKEMWQQRCRSWHALCVLASTISANSVAAADVVDVIGSNAVIALLSDAGIRLTMRSGSVQAYRHVLGTGSKNVLAHALLPITDAGDVVAELVCDRPALDTSTGSLVAPENQGIVAIAADLVETATEILRSAVSIHKIRQMEMHETAKYSANAQHKMDKLKHELRHAKDQLQLTTQQNARTIEDLAQQVQTNDALRASTSQAVTQFCAPAVAELSSQLQEMCATLLKDAGVDDKDLLRDLTNLSKSLSGKGKDAKSAGFGEAKKPDIDNPAQFSSTLAKPVSDMVTALKASLTRIASLQKQENQRKQTDSASKKIQTEAETRTQATRQPNAGQQHQKLLNESAEQVELTLQQLSRARKVHRVVCREASALLDPPFLNSIIGRSVQKGLNTSSGEDMRVGHPAALSPLAASQDCCMKLLNMIRTLLRTEGQSLLLRDPGTDPVTYQVIYTGDSLHWAGIEQGTFGVVSSSKGFVSNNGTMRTSLAETTMHSRKPIQTPNAPMDPRYYAYIDGICDLGTPILMVPMRGRGGIVVGVLIAARGKDAQPFSAEDIVAAEICSTLGALSLYWCQGMGQLHHQLAQNTSKTVKLERMLEKLQEKASN